MKERYVVDSEYLIGSCKKFLDGIAEELARMGMVYVSVPSCNKDESVYLVPAGTENQITYYGKPEKSFRLSDHWNWFTSIKNCANPHYVQCFSRDIRRARRRMKDGCPTKPIYAISVAIYVGGEYKVIYGHYYDRKRHWWVWRDNEPRMVINEYFDIKEDRNNE